MYPDSKSKSSRLFDRAKNVLPGGNSRHSVHLDPYPIYVDHGLGCRITDCDGVERIDCVNNMSALIHGHGHPAIIEAIQKQAQKLTSAGMPTESEILLAELLCDRVPSIEKIRFTNSGSEANLFALRVARVFTGRNKVAKLEGGYNGNPNSMEASVTPPPHLWGEVATPNTVPATPGLPADALTDTIVLPVDDVDAMRDIVTRNAGDLAAIILEPIITKLGFLRLSDEYLRTIRELTLELGIVLIFDEVFCFRYGYNGAQGLVGITPDMTTLGKIIGGGVPIGAVGGRKEIMDHFDPARGTASVKHGGTFNANPLSMAAGYASMQQLTKETFRHLDLLGDTLRDGLRKCSENKGVATKVRGYSSTCAIFFTEQEVTNYRTVLAGIVMGGLEVGTKFHHSMINEGVLIIAPGVFALSTAMTLEDIDLILAAVGRSTDALVADNVVPTATAISD